MTRDGDGASRTSSVADVRSVETTTPPVRHPLPIPWGRWARFWAGPCLALFGLGGWVACAMTRSCGGHGEASAISTLRNVASCQAQFAGSCHVDVDGDGIGEFGGFLEMSGARAPRGRDSPTEPVLSGVFRTLQSDGSVSRSGYRIRMFLVGKDGTARGEVQGIGFDEGELDPDASEARWICYAWPAMGGSSGRRTFVVNESGDIFATDCPVYSGPNGPRPGAAALLVPSSPAMYGRTASGCCEPPELLDRYDAPLADGIPARDGNVWRKLN